MPKTSSAKRKYTTITIPTPIFERIQAKIRNTSFSSVSDYVTYILRETSSGVALNKTGKDSDRMIEKLRALGYT
jgi:Arc/MetJ-type ribon-helix-helix transcriptional regulator